MAYKNFFYFDIETTSKSGSLFDLKLDDERGHDLFTKKHESMKIYEQDWNKPIEDAYVDKSPLYPEYGKIICFSFGMYKNDEKNILTIIDDDEEAILKKLVNIFIKADEKNRFLCGFNVKNFDLPYIIKKLYKYNIEIPRCLNFMYAKPWEVNINDISEIWKGLGRTTASLDEILYELNIEVPKTIKGEDVHDNYWLLKDKKSIINRCEQNVDSCMQIACKLKL